MRPVALLGLALVVPAHAQLASHPLDGVTAGEHWVLYETLRASGRLDSTAQFLYAGRRQRARLHPWASITTRPWAALGPHSRRCSSPSPWGPDSPSTVTR